MTLTTNYRPLLSVDIWYNNCIAFVISVPPPWVAPLPVKGVNPVQLAMHADQGKHAYYGIASIEDFFSYYLALWLITAISLNNTTGSRDVPHR